MMSDRPVTHHTRIRTKRLILRPFHEDDAPFVREIFNDESFLRFIGDRGVRTVEHARDYIARRLLPTHHPQGLGPFVTEIREIAQPIGFCTLFRRDWLENVDLGFAFLPKYRSRGFAIEASRALLEHARVAMGLERLAAIASSDNVASAKLLARLGFVQSGTIRPPGETSDVSLFRVDLTAIADDVAPVDQPPVRR